MLSDTRLFMVVAAAMTRPDGAVLVQQRPPGKPMAGLWEFPGGKLERGETPEQALARELHEELGVTIEPGALSPLAFASEPLGERRLVLLLYRLSDWIGEAEPRHATALRWVMPADLHALDMPPADRPLIAALNRPG